MRVGSAPDLYRPPYGIFSYPGMVEVSARGLRSLLWSRWGHDWRASRPPERIAAEVTEDLDAGDVLLLHDADHYSEPGCWRGTVEALPGSWRGSARRACARSARSQLTVSAAVSSSSTQRVAAVATTRAMATPMALSRIVPRCGMPRLKMLRVQGRVSRTT